MHHYRPDETDVFFGNGAPSTAFTDKPHIYIDKSTGTVWVNRGGSSSFYVANANGADIEVLTATEVLVAADNGKTLILNSTTEFDTKLPAPAANLRFTFIVGAAPSGASYTITSNGTTQNVIHGIGISSADAGGSASSTAGTAVDVITFVDGQAKVGDRVDLVCDGTLWYAIAYMSDEDAITFS